MASYRNVELSKKAPGGSTPKIPGGVPDLDLSICNYSIYSRLQTLTSISETLPSFLPLTSTISESARCATRHRPGPPQRLPAGDPGLSRSPGGLLLESSLADSRDSPTGSKMVLHQ